MSSMLSVLALTIIIKRAGYGYLPKELRKAFDIVAGLGSKDNAAFNAKYFKNGEKSKIPREVVIEFYQTTRDVERCKVIVDRTCILYDEEEEKVKDDRRQLRARLNRCSFCKRTTGFYPSINELLCKYFNLEFVIKIQNRSRYFTDVKTELAETLELIIRVLNTPSYASLKCNDIHNVLVKRTHSADYKETIITIDDHEYLSCKETRADKWCVSCEYLHTFGDRNNFIV